MATITKQDVRIAHGVKEACVQNTWYTRFIDEVTYNYFFLISFVIAVGSCLGGITAMYILKENAPIWQLFINIYLTMGCNVACIGQASTKWVLGLFSLSTLANIVLLLANVL